MVVIIGVGKTRLGKKRRGIRDERYKGNKEMQCGLKMKGKKEQGIRGWG